MKKLFMNLLAELRLFGEITAANLYRNGNFLSIEVEKEDGIYTLTVTKEEKNEGDK